jgi:hypothetical protein
MLRPPRDVAAAPRVLVAELAEQIGEESAGTVCEALLSGADPHEYAAELEFLGGRPAVGVLDGAWQPYWARVWGARGLLYVWTPRAAPAVVRALDDDAWRVAEMCLKVAARREIAEAAERAVALTAAELPRVRAQALRTLGLVGDTEHVEAVLLARDDPDQQVRRSAARAVERMAGRLDLDSARYSDSGSGLG